MLIRNYSLNAVEIKDPVFTNAFEKEQEYLRSIEADRLLAGFRETAGLEKKADRYPGGWENGEISGHTLGHYMVALSQLYAATGEEDIKERLDYILRELALCQNENGYLFTSGEAIFDRLEKGGLAWTPWYTLHKVLSGLLTVYQLVKMPQALDMAVKLGLWVYHRVSGWTDKVQKNVLSIEYGGMNDCLYELFKETGRTEFAEAAEKFDEVELFEQIAEGKDVLGNKHANATIPKFLGALNRYLVMPEKEEIYLKAAKKFFSIVQNGHTYVTGGNSEWEHFRVAGELGANRTQCNCETCNSYNMLKLAERLFIVTGAKKYMDFYERTFFNAILGSQNPETGMTTYYQPMATGFFKVFGKPFSKFWCCTGTGMESFTKLNRAIYHKTDERIYVNLYLSSVLKDKKRGVVLTQTVDINRFDSAEFELQTDGPKQFALCVRVPEWTKETVAVTINGEALECPQERGYLIIDRTWCFGDKAVVSFAPSLMLHPLPDAKNSAAVTYGPLVLAAGLGQDEMLIEKTGINVTVATRTVPVRKHITVLEGTVQEWFDNFETNFVKQDDMSFTLKGTDAEELLFTPYYKHYNGRYGIYFDYYTSEELPSELREEWDEKQRQEEERRRQEEEERLRREEEARIAAEKAAEEERLRKEEEERLAAEAAAEEERRRLEEEARLAAAAAEAELARLAAEAAEEEAARLATIAAEEEDRLRKEEEERRRQEEEERRQREEEERLRREEEDRLRKQEEERLAAIAAAEAAAATAIEEERRRQEEEERLRREEEERLAAEATAEEERLRREEEERIRKEEEERLAEEERLRREEEERLAEEERLRREEEERIRKEEEERLRKEEEERLRKEEEERLAEEARLAAIRAEEEAIAEMERRRREEEEMAAKIKEEAEKIAAQSVADAAHAAEVAEAKQREEEAALQATKFALERAQAEAELKKIQAEAEEADLAIETAKAAKAEQIAKQDKAKEASAKSVKKSFMKRNKFYKRRGIMKVLGTILAVLVVIVLLYVFAKPVTKGVFMAKDTVDTFLVKNFPKVAKTLKIKGDGAAIPVFQDDTKTVYCVEDAERFIATSVWPVGYQASVHKMDGKEYICVEGNGLKIYYLNELEENDVKHIYMEKGDYKAISFREYSFDNPDLLCPVAGVYNKDGADQYVFWDDEQKSSLTILDGETLENCRIAPIEPALEEMVDINAFTELEKTVLIDMEVQGVPYVFSVPKAAGAFNTADYAVNCTEGLVYTLQEDGLRFDAYVVSSGAYLGKVVGKMPCENQGYALKQLDFYAYAEESFGDQLQDPVIEATTLENAEKERVALVGDRGERLLIPVRSDVKRNEYDKDFFVKAQNGELSYNLYGQPASVKGIDVSKYQDKIDWTKVAASGAEYAMIRLGFRGMGPDGTCELDPFFKQNVQGATKAGMEVGVYFFSQATNEEEAKEEAQFVIKNLKNYKITWPVVFDTEEISTYDARANSITREMRTNCAKVFMDEIKAAGYTPMLYANTRWSILKLDMSKLQDYDFWYAYYGDPDSVYYPYHFTMWQYSNSGTVDGIKGNVDLNISFVDYGAKN